MKKLSEYPRDPKTGRRFRSIGASVAGVDAAICMCFEEADAELIAQLLELESERQEARDDDTVDAPIVACG